MSMREEPPGVSTETSSPTLLPSRALPTGDSIEIRPLPGSASAEPTMVKASSPYSSCTLTVEPTSTIPFAWVPSMMLALRTIFSSRRIRPSTKPCSFLASSYSAFSLMSPNSFACRMRSATSGRRLLRSTSSSACRRLRPSCVRYTTLSFSMVAIKSRRIIRDSRTPPRMPKFIAGLGQNLRRQGGQILADAHRGAHREDGQKQPMDAVRTRRQGPRGGPVGSQRRRIPGVENSVAERHALDGRHRLLPDLAMVVIFGPDVERLDAADLVVDRS